MTGDQLSIEDALNEADKWVGDVIPSRTTDPDTSHAAAAEIRIRANSQRARLLRGFWQSEYEDGPDGGSLTDEEAMIWAEGVSVQSEYAKRCSELREGGFIEETGETRVSPATGKARIVSRLTPKGRAWIQSNR